MNLYSCLARIHMRENLLAAEIFSWYTHERKLNQILPTTFLIVINWINTPTCSFDIVIGVCGCATLSRILLNEDGTEDGIHNLSFGFSLNPKKTERKTFLCSMQTRRKLLLIDFVTEKVEKHECSIFGFSSHIHTWNYLLRKLNNFFNINIYINLKFW